MTVPNVTPLVNMPGGWEWLIILAIVILIFGAAKLPDLARNSGQALRIFKSETRGLRDDDKDTETTDATPAEPAGELPSSEQPAVQPPVQPAVQPETPRNGTQSDKHQA